MLSLRTRGIRAPVALCVAVCLALLLANPSSAYSVLSHEAMVDALWDVKLKPVLLARFPNATPEQLKDAHAYAYGGAIIQDIGFYPHGKRILQRFNPLCPRRGLYPGPNFRIAGPQ